MAALFVGVASASTATNFHMVYDNQSYVIFSGNFSTIMKADNIWYVDGVVYPPVSPVSTALPSSTPGPILITNPQTTIFWFGAFIAFLIASAVIGFAFFPWYSPFAGAIGLIGTWWFYSSGVLIINAAGDWMATGWLILIPILIVILNFMMPAIKRK